MNSTDKLLSLSPTIRGAAIRAARRAVRPKPRTLEDDTWRPREKHAAILSLAAEYRFMGAWRGKSLCRQYLELAREYRQYFRQAFKLP